MAIRSMIFRGLDRLKLRERQLGQGLVHNIGELNGNARIDGMPLKSISPFGPSIGFLVVALVLIQLGPRKLQIKPCIAFRDSATAVFFPAATHPPALIDYPCFLGMDAFKARQLRFEMLAECAVQA